MKYVMMKLKVQLCATVYVQLLHTLEVCGSVAGTMWYVVFRGFSVCVCACRDASSRNADILCMHTSISCVCMCVRCVSRTFRLSECSVSKHTLRTPIPITNALTCVRVQCDKKVKLAHTQTPITLSALCVCLVAYWLFFL
jgi:hypothetical protein